MTERRRHVLAMILALTAPGLGRAILSRPWPGISLFLIFLLIWQIHLSPIWFNVILKFAIWSFFASIDITFVRKVIERHAD